MCRFCYWYDKQKRQIPKLQSDDFTIYDRYDKSYKYNQGFRPHTRNLFTQDRTRSRKNRIRSKAKLNWH